MDSNKSTTFTKRQAAILNSKFGDISDILLSVANAIEALNDRLDAQRKMIDALKEDVRVHESRLDAQSHMIGKIRRGRK